MEILQYQSNEFHPHRQKVTLVEIDSGLAIKASISFNTCSLGIPISRFALNSQIPFFNSDLFFEGIGVVFK